MLEVGGSVRSKFYRSWVVGNGVSIVLVVAEMRVRERSVLFYIRVFLEVGLRE